MRRLTVRYWRWSVVAAVLVLCGCGSGSSSQQRTGAAASATASPAATPQTISTSTTAQYTRLTKYVPSEAELPDHMTFVTAFDNGNEQVTNDAAQLKELRDSGRITGIEAVYSIEAGTHTIQFGISYYDNTDAPRQLLRRSAGDPADRTAPNRFAVPDLGDEYVAQRTRMGSGEAALNVINIVWVRGPFYVALADIGGTPDTPTDFAVKLAKIIDDKLKADPTP